MKRVIDPDSGLSLTMKLEDRGPDDCTCILIHNGTRIEGKATGIDSDVARNAYKTRDVEIFGQLIAPYDESQWQAQEAA